MSFPVPYGLRTVSLDLDTKNEIIGIGKNIVSLSEGLGGTNEAISALKYYINGIITTILLFTDELRYDYNLKLLQIIEDELRHDYNLIEGEFEQNEQTGNGEKILNILLRNYSLKIKFKKAFENVLTAIGKLPN